MILRYFTTISFFIHIFVSFNTLNVCKSKKIYSRLEVIKICLKNKLAKTTMTYESAILGDKEILEHLKLRQKS